MIPINKKRLIKIEPVEEEEENEMLYVIDEEGEAEIAAKRSLHFQRGHLRDFEIEKVAVDPKKETNTTVVEDQMSIQPRTRDTPEEMQEEMPEESVLLDIEEKGIFECSVCFTRFGLLTELREHKIECDKAEKKFECGICGNRFILEKSRDFHYEKICLKRLQEDERKRKEAEKKKQDEEDEKKKKEAEKKKQDEEDEKKKQEAEKKKQEEEDERKRKEAEKKKQDEEDEKKKKEAEKKKQEEEDERKKKEAEKKKKDEEDKRKRKEAEKKKKDEEDERKRKEAEKKKQDEEDEKKKKEGEKKKQNEEDKRKRKEAERKKEEEEEKKKEREEKEEDNGDDESEMQLKMCTRCLSIGYTVHSSQDCDQEEVHNPGLKLAFSA